MSWRRISCEEFEEHKSIMGDQAHVISSFTDLSGEFGEPRIETQWGRKVQARSRRLAEQQVREQLTRTVAPGPLVLEASRPEALS